jgi:hypothetical protein
MNERQENNNNNKKQKNIYESYAEELRYTHVSEKEQRKKFDALNVSEYSARKEAEE